MKLKLLIAEITKYFRNPENIIELINVIFATVFHNPGYG
jgi:hypothetical protein